MFGWFRPTCPVDEAAKAWMERQLVWLSDDFGLETFVERPIILPTHDFFPDPYDGTEESIRAMFDRVCGYMQVDPERFEIDLFYDKPFLGLVDDRGKYLPSGAAGTYQETGYKEVIRLEARQVGEPMNLVGTMAHELSHARLRGEGRQWGDPFDEELRTDLTAVYHGLGLFLANSPRNWDSAYSLWPDSTLKKPEYMTLPMYGYALAHQAWHRGETRPAWMRHMNLDVRAVFKQGLRYLQETGDSAFAPVR